MTKDNKLVSKTPSKAQAKAKKKGTSNSINSLHAIEDNPRFRKFLKTVRHGLFKIDANALIVEIQNMHSTRLSRRLTPTDVLKRFKSRFLESVLQKSAWRSRAAEIKMQCHKVLIDLDKQLPVMKKYLKSRYAGDLKEFFSTQAERDAYVDILLERAIKQKSELEGVIKHVDLFIEDLDASGWDARAIIDVMKIVNGRDAVSI